MINYRIVDEGVLGLGIRVAGQTKFSSARIRIRKGTKVRMTLAQHSFEDDDYARAQGWPAWGLVLKDVRSASAALHRTTAAAADGGRMTHQCSEPQSPSSPALSS